MSTSADLGCQVKVLDRLPAVGDTVVGLPLSYSDEKFYDQLGHRATVEGIRSYASRVRQEGGREIVFDLLIDQPDLPVHTVMDGIAALERIVDGLADSRSRLLINVVDHDLFIARHKT